MDKFSKNNRVQIIPIFTKETKKPYMPTFESGTDWPVRLHKDVLRFKPAISKRVDHIIMNSIKLNRKDRFLLWGGKVLFLKPKFTKMTLDYIIKNLQDHQLLRNSNK